MLDHETDKTPSFQPSRERRELGMAVKSWQHLVRKDLLVRDHEARPTRKPVDTAIGRRVRDNLVKEDWKSGFFAIRFGAVGQGGVSFVGADGSASW